MCKLNCALLTSAFIILYVSAASSVEPILKGGRRGGNMGQDGSDTGPSVMRSQANQQGRIIGVKRIRSIERECGSAGDHTSTPTFRARGHSMSKDGRIDHSCGSGSAVRTTWSRSPERTLAAQLPLSSTSSARHSPWKSIRQAGSPSASSWALWLPRLLACGCSPLATVCQTLGTFPRRDAAPWGNG
jgi:hypothetical protein